MSVPRPMLYSLPLIGWREDVHMPEIGIGTLVAKIDTGARVAALHAENIEVKGRHVYFTVLIGQKPHRHAAVLLNQKKIKSSNGYSELRPIVEILIQLGGHRILVETTLTNRGDMGVPMLLGRNAIKGKFVVNPGKSFLISRPKKKAK